MSQECDQATRAANRILDDSNSTTGSRSPVMLLSLFGPAKMEAHNLGQRDLEIPAHVAGWET